MQLTETLLRSAHFFAGAGGDMCGFSLAGLSPAFAVEINRYRCQTLRLNFPQCTIFEEPGKLPCWPDPHLLRYLPV